MQLCRPSPASLVRVPPSRAQQLCAVPLGACAQTSTAPSNVWAQPVVQQRRSHKTKRVVASAQASTEAQTQAKPGFDIQVGG